MEQVLEALYPDEPDYTSAKKLGAGALIYLQIIATSKDSLLASKATYLSSLINGNRSIDILKTALNSQYPDVGIAAADGIRNIVSKH